MAHLDDELLFIDHFHAKREEMARLGIVIACCIIALEGVLVEKVYGIVLCGDGKV